MSSSLGRVVIFGDDPRFSEYAVYHLATAGLTPVAVRGNDDLLAAIRHERPSLVLVHWDTLQDDCFTICAHLRTMAEDAGRATAAPSLAILTERLDHGPDAASAFAAGADGLIVGALNPKIFLPRVRALLRQHRR